MRTLAITALAFLSLSAACSPRDFLTRRLALDLIARSEVFRTPQDFLLHTGLVSNKLYLSPEYLVLQRHGWIVGADVACAPTITPPPCWEVSLTPVGAETFRDLSRNLTSSHPLSIPIARREVTEITGIAKNRNTADVEFHWKWTPLNEVGAVLLNGSSEYSASVMFKRYDDGWRVMDGSVPKNGFTLDESLKTTMPPQ